MIVDPLGLVFAGRSGSSAPIAGARVEVLTDLNLRALVRRYCQTKVMHRTKER